MAGAQPPTGVPLLSTNQALHELAEGFAAVCPKAAVEVQPFGGGAAFQGSVTDSSIWAFSQGRRESTSAGIARELLEKMTQDCPMPRLVLLNGGLNWQPDLGLGFVRTISADYSLSWDSPRAKVFDALAAVYESLVGLPLYYLADTQRRLLGLDSIVMVNPLLQARSLDDFRAIAIENEVSPEVDPFWAAEQWGKALAEYAKVRPTNTFTFPTDFAAVDVRAADPRFIKGGGAGGGLGALLAALGVTLCDTSEVLGEVTRLGEQISHFDLVVVAEPYLDVGSLLDSTIRAITFAALQWSIPVVAATLEITMSRHELAGFYLNGASKLRTGKGLFDLGRRLGQTWGTRP